MKLSVIVPMVDEEAAIGATLRALRSGAPDAELIVVDGGSTDRSVAEAHPLCDRLLVARRGRALQMNAGARVARGDIFAFVHADTIVPLSFADDIERALANPSILGGRFDLRLDDDGIAYRILAASINARSRLMRSATGDQAIFVRRSIFERIGGFAPISLCEDVDFARRLRRIGAVASLRSRVTTSARRWQRYGLIATILKMWLIKAMFLVGVSPARLQRMYGDARGAAGKPLDSVRQR